MWMSHDHTPLWFGTPDKSRPRFVTFFMFPSLSTLIWWELCFIAHTLLSFIKAIQSRRGDTKLPKRTPQAPRPRRVFAVHIWHWGWRQNRRIILAALAALIVSCARFVNRRSCWCSASEYPLSTASNRSFRTNAFIIPCRKTNSGPIHSSNSSGSLLPSATSKGPRSWSYGRVLGFKTGFSASKTKIPGCLVLNTPSPSLTLIFSIRRCFLPTSYIFLQVKPRQWEVSKSPCSKIMRSISGVRLIRSLPSGSIVESARLTC